MAAFDWLIRLLLNGGGFYWLIRLLDLQGAAFDGIVLGGGDFNWLVVLQGGGFNRLVVVCFEDSG